MEIILYQIYIYMTNPHYKCFFLRLFISVTNNPNNSYDIWDLV